MLVAKQSVMTFTILIEPLNKYDAPGYFLNTTHQALDIIKKIDLSQP